MRSASALEVRRRRRGVRGPCPRPGSPRRQQPAGGDHRLRRDAVPQVGGAADDVALDHRHVGARARAACVAACTPAGPAPMIAKRTAIATRLPAPRTASAPGIAFPCSPVPPRTDHGRHAVLDLCRASYRNASATAFAGYAASTRRPSTSIEAWISAVVIATPAFTDAASTRVTARRTDPSSPNSATRAVSCAWTSEGTDALATPLGRVLGKSLSPRFAETVCGSSASPTDAAPGGRSPRRQSSAHRTRDNAGRRARRPPESALALVRPHEGGDAHGVHRRKSVERGTRRPALRADVRRRPIAVVPLDHPGDSARGDTPLRHAAVTRITT